MKLKDTIDLMISEDYKDRFKAEYQQLKIRANKLNTMLKKYKDGTLEFAPKCSYEVLYEQFVHMKDYLDDLEKRANIEGISLLWLNDGAPNNAS